MIDLVVLPTSTTNPVFNLFLTKVTLLLQIKACSGGKSKAVVVQWQDYEGAVSFSDAIKEDNARKKLLTDNQLTLFLCNL